MQDTIKLQINGIDWQGWLSMQVNISVENIAGGFAIGLTEKWQEKQKRMPIACGMECKLYLNSDLVIHGFVDNVEHEFSSSSHSVTISGRDKTCDLADCSAVHTPGEFLNYNILQIAQALAKPFNIEVSSDAELGAPFPIFKLETGEKALDALKRGLKQRNLLAIPSKNGALKLAKLGSASMNEDLVEGINILSASLSMGMKNRYSDYICLGQQKGTDTAFGADCSTKGEIKDDEISRYRPLVVRSSQQGNAQFMKERAEWECKVNRAKGTNINVKVQGFRTANNELWQIGKKVNLKSSYFGIEKEFIISSTVFSRSLQGSFTEISLKEINAFAAEPIAPSGGSSSSSSSSSNSSHLSTYVQQSMDAKTEQDRISNGAE